MLGKEMLMAQFEYNDWANQRILKKAAHLDQEQLNRPSQIGERSLRQILFHLLSVERVWRLLAETEQVQPGQLPSPGDMENVQLMQGLQMQEHEAIIAFLAVLGETDFDLELTITRWDGIRIVMTRWHMLSHLLLHSMQHRTEAAVLLTNFGHSPGDIDFLYFVSSE